jgi:tetratricopeptide (TPR) repeat protein
MGSRYVMSVEAVEARSGNVLARQQQEADAKEQVLRALGAAAARLRGNLGESLQSIQKFDAPIEQATTSSLDAFKAFTAGEEQRLKGKYAESVALYQHAVELDPDFALAYSRLAAVSSTLREPSRAAENARRAFDLRARVTERERLYITANYHSNVTGELGPQIEALEMFWFCFTREPGSMRRPSRRPAKLSASTPARLPSGLTSGRRS